MSDDLDEDISVQCDLGYHERCTSSSCECGCHNKEEQQ